MSCEDTIAAIATAPGRGGIAIIRVSGSKALDVAKSVCHITPEARKAYFRRFYDAQNVIDEGVLLYFPGPNSYTGEDTVELQGHGGNVAPQRVLSAVLKIDGVRQAEPGEFTRRAFLNGKMDLTAAEAVEDLISAGSESAAKAALSSLEGDFAAKLNSLTDKLTTFRMRLEGCLDFPEEHEDFFDSGNAVDELRDLIALADESLTTAKHGVKLNEGARIVLAGSTITDTAGIRDTPSDEIEAIGIKRAIEMLKKADLVLLMVDASSPAPEAEHTLKRLKEIFGDNTNLLLIKSKSDLPENQETAELLKNPEFSQYKQISSSTKNAAGLDNLRTELKKALGEIPSEGVFSARRRHVNAIKETIAALHRAIEMLDLGDLVLCAREIAIAQDHLGTITGKVTSDDILGKIFSTFCIGK